MKKILFIVLFIITGLAGFAHPWKPNHYIIVDTDGGFDDFRAINLLIASPDVRVLAITASDGVLEAEQVYAKVKSLLYELHHEGVLVGIHNDSVSKAINCQPALDFSWGPPVLADSIIPTATEVVDFIIRNTNEKFEFVCLGSLNTVTSCLEEVGQMSSRLNRVIWTSDHELNDNNFNYQISPSSYTRFTEKYSIPLHRIYGDPQQTVYTRFFIQKMDSSNNLYSRNIFGSLKVKTTPYASHWYDESAALFIHFPAMFSTDSGSVDIFHQLADSSIYDMTAAMQKILNGNISNQNQVLSHFPEDPDYYQDDVKAIMKKTIYNFGQDEWTAGVLGNELHRHLGIYAIIGVKMGIRAREYFGAGVDEMLVLSYAGLTPPFSCMNDGLQVSTGATLGHGLIRINPGDEHSPEAEFTYMGQTISIRLKDEYRKKIESEVRELNTIYGLNNNIYWALVRKSALYYWENWDRNLIFDIHYVEPDK